MFYLIGLKELGLVEGIQYTHENGENYDLGCIYHKQNKTKIDSKMNVWNACLGFKSFSMWLISFE